MASFIVAGILVLIIGAAVLYIVKAKKKGVKCIGCPDGETCGKNGGCAGCSGCHSNTKEENRY